jgi:hypothetical protein
MRATAVLAMLCAGLILPCAEAQARVGVPGKHFNDWYDSSARDEDSFFHELSLINYFFTRFTATNQLPDPSGLRGVSLGPIGIGQSTGSATRVHEDTRNILAEQRWIPVLTFSPYFTSGWAAFRAAMEVDFTWGIAANTVQPNLGGGFNADQVNIQTKNVYAALFPTQDARELSVLIGTQPVYDSILNPHHTSLFDIIRTGYKLSFLGSDATGVSVYSSYLGLAKLSILPFGAAQPDKALEDDPSFKWVYLLTADIAYPVMPGTVLGLSYWHLQDDTKGAAYAYQGLVNSGPASSGLSSFTGTGRLNIDKPTGHVEYLGFNFHHNIKFHTGPFAASGFLMYNFGGFRSSKEDTQLNEKVRIQGVAANAELLYNFGKTPDDLITLEGMFASGDSDPNDDEYSSPFTMNFYGLPGAVWFNHRSLLLFPFTSTVSNYTGAVTDIANQGFGLISGILTGSYDVIPYRLNLKVGYAFGMAAADPPELTDGVERGRYIGSEINAEVRYHIRYLMTVGLHGAYMFRGGFYDGNEQVTADPWAFFTTFTWYAF